MTENVSKMCFIVKFKISKRHPHFFMDTIGFLVPKNMGIHQNRDSSYAWAQAIAKYVISMAAILNVS